MCQQRFWPKCETPPRCIRKRKAEEEKNRTIHVLSGSTFAEKGNLMVKCR